MTPFIVFGLGALGTYLLRITMILGEGRITGAAWIQRHLSLVSPAVLAAIVAGALLTSGGSITMPDPLALAAVGVGAYGVHRTGNVAVALAMGLPVYWLGSLIELL